MRIRRAELRCRYVLLVVLGPWMVAPTPSRALPPETSLLKSLQVESDTAGLRTFLMRFSANATHAEIQQWIGLLGSEQFAQREKATARLLAQTYPPTKELRACLDSFDAEVQNRARNILAKFELRPPVSAQLFAACLVIRDQAIPGLAPELLKAVPHCENPAALLAAAQAMRATARSADRTHLELALKSDHAQVRTMALVGLHFTTATKDAAEGLKELAAKMEAATDPVAHSAKLIRTPPVSWLHFIDAYVVHGKHDGAQTEFVKGLPPGLVEHFTRTTRSASTVDAVMNRNATAPWLYPIPGKNELPRTFVEDDKKCYPVWGTWRQHWSRWIALDENGNVVGADRKVGAHLETRVDYLLVPISAPKQKSIFPPSPR